jgi:hypothetical protein
MRARRENRLIPEKTRQEILAMVKAQEGELEAMVLEQHQAAGIHGFREAVKSGRLQIHPFRQTSAEAIIGATLRGGGNLLYGIDFVDLLVEYIDEVSGAVTDGSTYPVFDDLTGDFVAEALNAGLITAADHTAHRSRYGGISNDLLQRLPLFETASLSDSWISGARSKGRCGASGSQFVTSRVRSARLRGSRASPTRLTGMRLGSRRSQH